MTGNPENTIRAGLSLWRSAEDVRPAFAALDVLVSERAQLREARRDLLRALREIECYPVGDDGYQDVAREAIRAAESAALSDGPGADVHA